jgi:hypothetical protein
MSDTSVLIETMPEQLRAARRSTGNWGKYPVNGAVRERVEINEAQRRVQADPDGYTHILDGSEAPLWPHPNGRRQPQDPREQLAATKPSSTEPTE